MHTYMIFCKCMQQIVQFNGNYAPATFRHHNTISKGDTVTVFVCGVNLPLLIWLLQLRPFSEIAKVIGFSFTLYDNKKDAGNCDFLMNMPPDKSKVIGINITKSENAKLIKAICMDLQGLFNKLLRMNLPFDLYSKDQDALYVQMYAPTDKKKMSYQFAQIITYIMDTRYS